MKMSEVRELNDKDLRERIQDLKSTLTQLRINHAVSPLDNPMQINLLKKDIARLMTELQQRELTKTTN
ncbi:MAG: 50S ribosomal protein L29 [Bacteroidales bacterium]|jgi:large subunit ribosomal protein L29|nr:50S ribosomal protein L29 [Bacteroidales bacterium]